MLQVNKHKHLVYKSNDLIEAHFKLSTAAQKITIILISNINPKINELPKFTMSVKNYAHLLDITPQAVYKSIDKITTEFKKAVVVIRQEK